MIRILSLGNLILMALGICAIAAPCAAGDPGAQLCEGFAGASANEKANRLAEFYQATVTEPILRPPFHLDCVAEAIAKLEPAVADYCGERSQRGHGVLLKELDNIRWEFDSVVRDCEREVEQPFLDRIKAPIYCRDIEGYLRDSLPVIAPVVSPSQLACMRRAIPRVAARLRASCDSEPIPGPVAGRYIDALAAACPEVNDER